MTKLGKKKEFAGAIQCFALQITFFFFKTTELIQQPTRIFPLDS